MRFSIGDFVRGWCLIKWLSGRVVDHRRKHDGVHNYHVQFFVRHTVPVWLDEDELEPLRDDELVAEILSEG